MNRSRATLVTLCLAVPILAAACVTITPIKVASLPSSAPTTDVGATPFTPVATPISTPSATPEPTDSPRPIGKPGKTPRPNKSDAPTADPTDVTPTQTPTSDDPACTDDAYTLEGFSWDEPFKWRYNSLSTPAGYDRDTVIAILQKGFDNVVNENNNCGRPDSIGQVATYMGTTPLMPCTSIGDATNVVGWGKMPDDLSPDTIAYTCPYHFTGSGEIAEADIVLSIDIDWSLNADDCLFQELLEPTITHEVGHALGLGHVTERGHPDLTMSTRSNGACSNEESTLGLGDMLGLESLYPSE